MRFILLVLISIKLSAAVANINYSEAELSDSQKALTNAIMTAITEECDHLETREAYYNCVSGSVSKIIKAGVLPAPSIPWEQNPPREPGPDDVDREYPLVNNVLRYGIKDLSTDEDFGIYREYPLVMVMPDYPYDDDRRSEHPDDRPKPIPLPRGSGY